MHVATSIKKGNGGEFHSWRWATGWIETADWRNVDVADMNNDGLLDQVGQAKDGTWWVAENVGGNFRNFYLDRTAPGVTVDFLVDAEQRSTTSSVNVVVPGANP